MEKFICFGSLFIPDEDEDESDKWARLRRKARGKVGKDKAMLGSTWHHILQKEYHIWYDWLINVMQELQKLDKS